MILLLGLGPGGAPAQEGPPSPELPAGVYTVRRVRVEGSGRIRREVLLRRLNIREGQTLPTRRAWRQWLNQKREILAGLRPLAPGSTIICRYEAPRKGESGAGAPAVPVELTIAAEEGQNRIILPYGKYDSNRGLLVSLRARDYNFLGTMEELAVNLDYDGRWGGETEFDMPLRAGGHHFLWHQAVDYRYAPPGGAWEGPQLPGNRFEAEQALYWVAGIAGTGWVYQPGILLEAAHKAWEEEDSPRRWGTAVTLEHSFAGDSVRWKGHYREGEQVRLENSWTWQPVLNQFPMALSAEGAVHRIHPVGGVSARFLARFYPRVPQGEMGGPLRGVLDRRIGGVRGAVYGNLDLPFTLWVWFLEPWFEGHLGPFADAAVILPAERAFDPGRDIWYSAGLEGIAFSRSARSLFLRGSLGWDLREVVRDGCWLEPAEDGFDRMELYIGLGHHY